MSGEEVVFVDKVFGVCSRCGSEDAKVIIYGEHEGKRIAIILCKLCYAKCFRLLQLRRLMT
jgi:hypothetical protein